MRKKYEDTVYGKLGMAMTKSQIKQWNAMRYEMYGIADYLADRHQMDVDYDRATRLLDMVGRMPIFDADGQGCMYVGSHPEDELFVD